MKETRSERKTSWKKELISWGKVIVTGALLGIFLNSFIIVNASVASGSMENTLMTGDRVFGNRLAYLSKGPERYDVVIFLNPDNESEKYIKRVIGLPGEKVEIREGKVYIDDGAEPLPDYFVNGEPYGDYGPFQVPEGHYFMMGDNRNHSHDSKNWNNTYVAKNKLLGKLLICYYPEVRVVEEIA